MSVLQINNLVKNYGSIRAVNGLSLDVERGNIYGILGPNGSGKTTTLGIVLGIIKQTSGTYQWFDGADGDKARLRVGALLETPNFYPYMTAEKNLELIAHIKKDKTTNLDELLDLVNLRARKKHKFKTYSLGMKQRLAIAGAMVGDPEVLIFDEPTNGLDPSGIVEVRNTIIRIAESGKTIIMASHILDEVEKTCSHVAIMRKGKMLATGTVGAILTTDRIVEVGSSDLDSLRNFASGINGIKKVEQTGDHLILTFPEDGANARDINQAAFEKGIILTRLIERKRSLESEFLEITSKYQ